ncbi:MAG: methyltransferase, RsmE family [Actinomycetia bacterium]|nr:methyltransferase, RsmE family [Actinomycetes bacterium]
MLFDGWAADVQAAAHVFVRALEPAVEVSGVDGHHLERVRRVRAGERVTASDGAGNWRLYEVSEAANARIALVAVRAVMHEPVLTPPLAVAFALTKREKPEVVVQKLTELGVDRILPVVGSRSVVQWDERKSAAALARWDRVAREAAMQCRRSRLPTIADVVPLSALAGTSGLIVADRGASESPTGVPLVGPDGWVVLVGPEGGFSPEELIGLDEAGPVARLAVGPHVLRAETAAIAAASVLAAQRTVGDA